MLFYDDILVYRKSLEGHVQHLQQVFQAMKGYSLVAKNSQCSFSIQQVEYLGHYIFGVRVTTDPQKMEVVAAWPTRKTIKELIWFLGLAGYYRRFVKNYAIIIKPDLGKTFMVETDACINGTGVVLMQGGHLLAYISRALGAKWPQLSVFEKELLTIVHAVQKWVQYLSGQQCIILIDQKILKCFWNGKYQLHSNSSNYPN